MGTAYATVGSNVSLPDVYNPGDEVTNVQRDLGANAGGSQQEPELNPTTKSSREPKSRALTSHGTGRPTIGSI